jgi:hypothetical protein
MRRKLITGLALGLAALCAWAAAPALSLNPYMPGAEDFERTLPVSKRLGAGQVRAAARAHEAAGHTGAAPRWISPPVRAQHSFDLVGVAREMRAVEIRVRDEGGEWSEWVEQTDGTPVFVDGAEEAQVRAPFRPRGALHFVNVSGTAGGTAERLLNSAREAVNSAFLAVVSTPVAQALSPKPKVRTRASWGADLPAGGCPPRGPAEYGTVSAAVIHHTVNANDYTRDEAPAIVLGICRFHVYGNGWNDIGYNALVDRYGVVYEGRAGGLKRPVVGAQAQGFNAQTTSIASIGDHTSEGITQEARASVTRYLAWKLGVNRAVPATALTTLTSSGGPESRYPTGAAVALPRVIGHADLGLTACPGAMLAPAVPSIRKGVQKRIKRYAKRKGNGKGKAKRKRGMKRSGGAQPAAR